MSEIFGNGIISGVADLSVTADKIASKAVTTEKIADKAVTTEQLGDASVGAAKIKDGAVTRTKLARSVLTTPVLDVPSTYTAKLGDIGMVYRFNNINSDYVLNIVQSDTIPVGAAYAIYRHAAKSNKIVFGDTTKVAFMGESNLLVGPTFTIQESFGEIAIMKIAADDSYDYWKLSGAAEVVT